MSKHCHICNTEQYTELIEKESEFKLSRYDFPIKCTDKFYRCNNCNEQWYEAGMLDEVNFNMMNAIPEDKILPKDKEYREKLRKGI